MKRKNLIKVVVLVAFTWIVFNHYSFTYNCLETGTIPSFIREGQTIETCVQESFLPSGIERERSDRRNPDYLPDVLVLLGAGLLIWQLKKHE